MYDYMKALHERFKTTSIQQDSFEREVNRLHRQLSKRLRKPERKMLLKLMDLEMELRDESNLDSFMTGYRVANGIHQELSRHPPYNFEDENERQACQQMAADEEKR